MKQLNPGVEQNFSDWQRGLLATRGKTISATVANSQVELHRVVSDGPQSLADYLRNRLGLTQEESIDVPLLPSPVTSFEYRDPPFELERTVCNLWDGLICRQNAARPIFWTLAHIRWLEEGQLGQQIEETLLRGGGRDSTEDQRTRNLLRRVGGLPHVRGKVSVLSDSPISRAWWRGSVASEIAYAAGDDLSLNAVEIHQVLHSHNDAWARLIGDSIHRITVLNQPRARAALVNLYKDARRGGEPIRPLEMQLTARILSRHGVALAFDLIDWEDLAGIAEEALERAREQLELDAGLKAEARTEETREGDTQHGGSEPDSRRKTVSRLRRIVRL